MRKDKVEKAICYIEALFDQNADGHDAAHSLRVYKNAMNIAKAYPESDDAAVALAALLHDADDHKLFHTVNNENAREFLRGQQMEEEEIHFICELINGVSFSKNRGKSPASIEGKIVQDADRLDALGAIGVARTFAYGGKVGRSMEESVQHFYDKLLHLKDEMNTTEAKMLAEEKHAFLERFLEEWKKENE